MIVLKRFYQLRRLQQIRGVCFSCQIVLTFWKRFPRLKILRSVRLVLGVTTLHWVQSLIQSSASSEKWLSS